MRVRGQSEPLVLVHMRTKPRQSLETLKLFMEKVKSSSVEPGCCNKGFVNSQKQQLKPGRQ
eukprot:6053642-Ditylum_brightwellii.AAC.1